jgi:hypothetical protein
MLPESQLVVIHAANDASLTDDVRHSLGGKQWQPSLDIVLPDYALVGIGQERVGKVEGLTEAPMAVHRVRADSNDHPVEGNYGFMYITEATRFNRSPFGEILQVKIKNNILEPRPVRQAECGAIIERAAEIGSCRAYP